MIWRKNIPTAVCFFVIVPGIVFFSQSFSQEQYQEHRSFQKDIDPLLKMNCKPCHYSGGKMFQKLPFEQYQTVRKLGKKLNTRFKQKTQIDLITRWVDEGSPEK